MIGMSCIRSTSLLGCTFLAGFLMTACKTVDHRSDLQSADVAMERATGVKTAWADLPDVKTFEPTPDTTVSLDTVVDLALTNNRTLRADLEVIGQAKADFVQAGLLSNPVLSLMGGLPEGGGRAKLGFGLSKDIADLWLIPSRKQAAQAMVQQRVLSFTDTAIALLTEAKTNYYSLQYEFVAADLQEQNLRILQESMEIAQARFRAGDTTQLDVNLIRARYVEAEVELLQLRSDYRVTQRTLLRLMGVSTGSDDWKPEPLKLDEPPQPIGVDEPSLVEAALLQRLDVQAASWELESAVADFEQQRRRVFPSLTLGLSGERSDRRASPDRDILADTARASVASGTLTAPAIQSRAERRKERRQEIDFVLGPSIDVPLPVFDQNQAQIAKAQFRARELQQRYEEVEQRVVEGVRSAFTQRRLAEDRVRLYHDTLVPLQEANLELSQTAYQSGRESILTVLLAQESLIRTRLAFAAAARDLAISATNLERQMAGRLPEPALTPPPTP
jgi:cobalt-zinc-cadmium efflux system outer membrane protein